MDGAAFRPGEPIIDDRTSRIWWVTLLRALGALVFGGLTLLWPKDSARALIAMFGAYAVFDGATMFLVASKAGRRGLWLTLGATANVAVGLIALTQPKLMALTLMRVIGGWLVLRGLAELIWEPSRDPADPPSPGRRRDWGRVLNAWMCALFGVGLIAAPKIGVLSLMWAVGVWAMLHGLLLLAFAMRLRRGALRRARA